jgi:hypothetical protein
MDTFIQAFFHHFSWPNPAGSAMLFSSPFVPHLPVTLGRDMTGSLQKARVLHNPCVKSASISSCESVLKGFGFRPSATVAIGANHLVICLKIIQYETQS